MAGESLNYAEIKSWYDIFNDVITNYGGEIDSLSTLVQGKKVYPDDVNNIFNKIDEFINDEFLGTQPTLYNTDYSIVQSGTRIIRSTIVPISETATNIAQIKCRNKITYSSGNNSNGTHDNGSNSNLECSKGTCQNGTKSNLGKTYGGMGSGTRSNDSYISGTNHNGYHGYGSKSNGANTNGIKTNGALIDILNANTSY